MERPFVFAASMLIQQRRRTGKSLVTLLVFRFFLISHRIGIIPGGKSTNLSELIADKVNRTDLTNGEPTTMYSYKRYSDSKGTFGSTDVNVDFQHSTSKKDELLTLSYRFSQSPNDNEGHSRLEDLEGVYSQAYRYPNCEDMSNW